MWCPAHISLVKYEFEHFLSKHWAYYIECLRYINSEYSLICTHHILLFTHKSICLEQFLQ